MDDQFLTTQQVARLLQLRPQTIREAVARGAFPCIRLWTGKRKTLLRFKKADIEDFIRRKSEPATPGS